MPGGWGAGRLEGSGQGGRLRQGRGTGESVRAFRVSGSHTRTAAFTQGNEGHRGGLSCLSMTRLSIYTDRSFS